MTECKSPDTTPASLFPRAARGFWILLAIILALPAAASPRRRPAAKSPHFEIVAIARVETPPRRVVHKNHRSFEEADVSILTFRRAEEAAASDPEVSVDRTRPVHLVHDLTCGGQWIDLKAGDRIEIKGEYVHPADGKDLIHFTHPASEIESCGRGGHPGGYLKPLREAAEVAPGQAVPPARDLFAASMRPILARRCSPCHEKGGKMYARLPFDQPETLSSHVAGVRKRLKGDDLAAFEAWLTTVSETPAVRSE